MQEVVHWSALGATVVSVALLVHMIMRAPRNRFSLFLGAIIASIAVWNFFEWLRYGEENWLCNMQFVAEEGVREGTRSAGPRGDREQPDRGGQAAGPVAADASEKAGGVQNRVREGRTAR